MLINYVNMWDYGQYMWILLYVIQPERGMNVMAKTLKEIYADQKKEFEHFYLMYQPSQQCKTAPPSTTPTDMSVEDLKKRNHLRRSRNWFQVVRLRKI